MEYVKITLENFRALEDRAGNYLVQDFENVDGVDYLIRERYFVDDVLHRHIEPAVIDYVSLYNPYFPEGSRIQSLAWYIYGAPYRDGDLPVLITFYIAWSPSSFPEIYSGNKREERYCNLKYLEGPLNSTDRISNLHRDGKPALLRFDRDGSLLSESYYQYGKMHNENGPAYISRLKNGAVEYSKFYLDGEEYLEEDYLKQMQTKLYW